MTTLGKIRTKIFIISLGFEVVVNGCVFAYAYFSNKILETVFFYIVWQIFRKTFPKVLHFKGGTALQNIIGCAITSVGIFVIAIKNIMPLYLSIFSSIIIGMATNYLLYTIKCYLDLKDKQLANAIDIYKMSENELRVYALSKGVSEQMVETLVLKVVHHMRWCDISKKLNYSKDGIIYHRKQINKKLNITL